MDEQVPTANALKPWSLRQGDQVAIVAPAGPTNREEVEAGIELLRSLGLIPRVMPHVLDRDRYLAGSDESRLGDLLDAWRDDTIAGVFCARGGYGSMRIVDRLDYDAIAAKPKAFVGFSDITSLHLAIRARTGLVTFHGPSIAWRTKRLRQATIDSLHRALTWSTPLGPLIQPSESPPVTVITPGQAAGQVVGGNLSLVCAGLGTRDEIDCTGAILLLEDTAEPPYKLDRLLTQLIRAGKLGKAAGIVFGEFRKADGDENRPMSALDEVLRDRLGSLAIPAISGLAIGHGDQQLTIPLGVHAYLDADSQSLVLTEAATRARPNED